MLRGNTIYNIINRSKYNLFLCTFFSYTLIFFSQFITIYFVRLLHVTLNNYKILILKVLVNQHSPKINIKQIKFRNFVKHRLHLGNIYLRQVLIITFCIFIFFFFAVWRRHLYLLFHFSSLVLAAKSISPEMRTAYYVFIIYYHGNSASHFENKQFRYTDNSIVKYNIHTHTHTFR